MTRVSYTLTRNIHLTTGLFAALFLMAYGMSAAQMAYPIYDPEPRVTETTLTLPPELPVAGRPLARWLMNDHDLGGDLREVATGGDTLHLLIERPGSRHEIEVEIDARTAHVRSTRENAIGLLNRLHHTGGVHHQFWATNAWGWFLLAASICLLILALTGTVMWFLRHRERRVGAVVFAAGLAWGLGLLILARLS